MYKKALTALCLLVAAMGANAFVAPAAPTMRAATVMSMSAAPKVGAIATASAALLTSAPVLATEGTSEAFGIDSPLGFWLPLTVIVFINLIFFQWARTQPEGEFFGEYDERRK
ncbi:hypothetical protein JKP88DRAFT_12062 [Tribonema minus]|uniref:PSII 6.1 kDa protein n=1 Tax=Tribonema minus TaxID=303371 RepID=A0A835ZAY3_9STRA|nr:hypothetical protein JKP88DRAFT_12062 [Tribonema minus]